MWGGRLFGRSSTYLRGARITRTSPSTHTTSRDASGWSILPFRKQKKKKDEQAIGQGLAASPNTKEAIVATQNRVKKFEKQKEKFIPVTRRTLVNKLVEEDGLLNWEEKRLLESFAASLDAYYSQKFYALLEEAKVSYGKQSDHFPSLSMVCINWSILLVPSISMLCCVHFLTTPTQETTTAFCCLALKPHQLLGGLSSRRNLPIVFILP